jgi:AcrR family transcriptional regulator
MALLRGKVLDVSSASPSDQSPPSSAAPEASSPAPTRRRIGSADSETRAKLLDAAERLMLEEGYAAVTTRRVGAAAGLKPQLVHYYFESMDDLFVELFKRGAEVNLAHLAKLAEREPTLETFWSVNADSLGGALTIEFIALANHRKALRSVIVDYSVRFRTAQLDLARKALEKEGVAADIMSPVVLLLITNGLAQILSIEKYLGVTEGHQETMDWIEAWLASR